MAIEPLGSVMTMQAQGVISRQPVTVEKAAEVPENVISQTELVDKTTPVVENAQGKGQEKQSKDQSEQQATNDQIRKAVEQLNKKMSSNSEAIFGIHEETNRVTIKIVDKSTKETIKELPPEKTLDMIAKVWELAGILVDERR